MAFARRLRGTAFNECPPSPPLLFAPYFPQGAIVEGSDSEIRAAVFIVALTREFEPERGTLAWKAVEVAMHGSQLYL